MAGVSCLGCMGTVSALKRDQSVFKEDESNCWYGYIWALLWNWEVENAVIRWEVLFS